ncbi:MAG: ABC transporter permease [Pyrinomonadaceae bacterium]
MCELTARHTYFVRVSAKNLKNFLAVRAMIAGIICILLAGFYGMFYGKNVIDGQRKVISELPQIQAAHVKQNLSAHSAFGLGDVLFYLELQTAHLPSDWAAFSLGQRDVNSYSVKVRLLTLEGQLYDTELNNPMTLLFGNLDVAFVIIFLFPLLIIAFNYNVLSAEQESGTWNLIRSQPFSTVKVLLLKLSVRFAAIFLTAFLLLLAACLYLQVGFDRRIFAVAKITFVSLFFWFGVSALVVSFGRSSNFNALALLGIWIFLTILAPAVANIILNTALPVPEAMETTVEQREGYHEKWDEPKAATMNRFYEKYPEYAQFPIPPDKFSWGWYYAMNEMGDEDSAASSQKLIEKLRTREIWTNRIAMFLPSVNAQMQLNRISETDLDSHIAYLEWVRKYHEQIRKYFYPYIFRDSLIEAVHWQNLPAELPDYLYSREPAQNFLSKEIISLFLLTCLIYAIVRRNLRENTDLR